jgi:hypothetical protein
MPARRAQWQELHALRLPVCCAFSAVVSAAAGWVLFAFCTFFCCALLMPINATANGLVSTMQ